MKLISSLIERIDADLLKDAAVERIRLKSFSSLGLVPALLAVVASAAAGKQPPASVIGTIALFTVSWIILVGWRSSKVLGCCDIRTQQTEQIAPALSSPSYSTRIMAIWLGILEACTRRTFHTSHVYTVVMWTNITVSSIFIFVITWVALALYGMARGIGVDHNVIVIIDSGTTTLFAIRFYLVYREKLRPHFFRTELARVRQHRQITSAAVDQLIESMVHLSSGDISVFQTLLAMKTPDDLPIVLTSQGSPNHHVLVQMSDLGVAKPVAFNTLGVPPHTFTSVSYAITPQGQAYISKLLPAVMWCRSVLAGGDEPSDHGRGS